MQRCGLVYFSVQNWTNALMIEANALEVFSSFLLLLLLLLLFCLYGNERPAFCAVWQFLLRFLLSRFLSWWVD